MNNETGSQQVSLLGKGVGFWKECREELGKVSSPTRQETIQISIVTVILMIVIALALGLMDVIFGTVMSHLLS